MRSGARYVLSVDLSDKLISLYEVKTQNNSSRHVNLLLKMSRSKKSNKKLKLFWSNEAGGCERYIFLSSKEREVFYEACWVARSHLTRVVCID